jgi:hypothetical protein
VGIETAKPTAAESTLSEVWGESRSALYLGQDDAGILSQRSKGCGDRGAGGAGDAEDDLLGM